MRSDKRSTSFTFYRGQACLRPTDEVEEEKKTRQKLQDRFDTECPYSLKSIRQDGKQNERRWTNMNLSSVSLPPIHPRRVLRSGADKLTQTFNNVRTTFGTLSQKFRGSTRRRYRLKESPSSPVTPQTRSRNILGRTPTKLYSPFGIDSPCKRKTRSSDKENDVHNGGFSFRRSSRVNHCTRAGNHQLAVVYSPRRKFNSDVEEARIGVWELDQTANKIVRHSMRH